MGAQFVEVTKITQLEGSRTSRRVVVTLMLCIAQPTGAEIYGVLRKQWAAQEFKRSHGKTDVGMTEFENGGTNWQELGYKYQISNCPNSASQRME